MEISFHLDFHISLSTITNHSPQKYLKQSTGGQQRCKLQGDDGEEKPGGRGKRIAGHLEEAELVERKFYLLVTVVEVLMDSLPVTLEAETVVPMAEVETVEVLADVEVVEAVEDNLFYIFL